MLKVSQNGNTILHLSFLPSESKIYHGRYEKYTTIKDIWHFWMQHSTRSVYPEWTTIVHLLPNACNFSQGKFPYRQRIHFTVNTKSRNTKTIMCSSWSKRHSSPSNLLFPEKLLISLLTNQNLITVDSKRTEQTIHSVISNVRIRTNHHQMQMLILNRLD